MELLQKYFPEDKYTINDVTNKSLPRHFIKNENNLEVYEITDKIKNNCVSFTVFNNPETNKKGIYINKLDKCTSNTGTNLLNIIEQYAIERGDIVQIDLQDASNLELCDFDFEFSLYYLYLLTTGSSWYNKLGYISEDYAIEKEHNMIEIQKNFAKNLYNILNQSLIDIKGPKGIININSKYSHIYSKLRSVFNEYFNIKFDINKQHIEEILENSFFKICETLNKIVEDIKPELLEDSYEDPFSLIETFTIQELFIILHNYIKKHKDECNNNDVRLNFSIISLVLVMFKILFTIKYDSQLLTKVLLKTGGKRSNRRSRKQNKKKRKKQSRKRKISIK